MRVALGQHLQGQVLAVQQVTRALIGRAVAAAGELHDHAAPLRHAAELGLLPPGGRARQLALQRAAGQQRVVVGRGGPCQALAQGVKARERGITHDEVARQVLAAQRQGTQHVVVGPVARVLGQLQIGMQLRKVAPHEALGPHVGQKPGQAVVALAHAIHFIHPEGAAHQGHHAAKGCGHACGVDTQDGDVVAHPCHRARQQVALRTRRAHLAHPARAHQRHEGARHRGLAHAQRVHQLRTGGHAAVAAQGLQDAFSVGSGCCHAALYE